MERRVKGTGGSQKSLVELFQELQAAYDEDGARCIDPQLACTAVTVSDPSSPMGGGYHRREAAHRKYCAGGVRASEGCEGQAQEPR